MARTKTKIEITLEKRQRVTVRGRRPGTEWCERCSAEAQMLPAAEAAALVQTSARDIFRRVESGELHFLETGGGGLLVCRNSLADDLEKSNLGKSYRKENWQIASDA